MSNIGLKFIFFLVFQVKQSFKRSANTTNSENRPKSEHKDIYDSINKH